MPMYDSVPVAECSCNPSEPKLDVLDLPEALARRQRTYRELTLPLVERMRERGTALYEVEVQQSLEPTWEQVQACVSKL